MYKKLLLTSAFLLMPVFSASAQGFYTLSPSLISAPKIEKQTEGVNTDVITKEEIERSSARNIPELLRQFGIHVSDDYGTAAAARSTVDLRGFGASGGSNTLILLNGRRLNAADESPVNFAGLLLSRIERIEITRGTAAGVLYGEGAVGGAVNIITKANPKQLEAGGKVSYGSFDTQIAEAHAGMKYGQIRGSYLKTDGYRHHNKTEQSSIGASLGYSFGNQARIYLTGDYHIQELDLPGVLSSADYEINPKTTDFPLDFSEERQGHIGLGGVYHFSDTMRFYLPLNANFKRRDSDYFYTALPANDFYVRMDLNTYTFQPKLQGETGYGDYVLGIDFAYHDYQSKRGHHAGEDPYHTYNADQMDAAVYGQMSSKVMNLFKTTFGLRGIYSTAELKDKFDASAPGASGSKKADYDKDHFYFAANAGLDYSILPSLSVYGNVAHNVRLPNMDERIGAEDTFDLKAQKSVNYEVGARYVLGTMIEVEGSAYWMTLKDELHYNPYEVYSGGVYTGYHINLDPTQRLGIDARITFKPADWIGVRGSYSFIDAEFRKGDFKGNDVPLVPKHLASINVFGQYDMFYADAALVYVGKSRMDNDQVNTRKKANDYLTVDAKIGVKYQGAVLDLIVTNLLDKKYYSYAVAAADPAVQSYSVNPMPGRSFLVSVGASF